VEEDRWHKIKHPGSILYRKEKRTSKVINIQGRSLSFHKCLWSTYYRSNTDSNTKDTVEKRDSEAKFTIITVQVTKQRDILHPVQLHETGQPGSTLLAFWPRTFHSLNRETAAQMPERN
jgi:hypothetical protein